jgi:hypothetical protein
MEIEISHLEITKNVTAIEKSQRKLQFAHGKINFTDGNDKNCNCNDDFTFGSRKIRTDNDRARVEMEMAHEEIENSQVESIRRLRDLACLTMAFVGCRTKPC